MRAIDTNIIIRYVTRDDPKQAERARRLVQSETVYLSATVFLESAWVLESSYGYDRAQIAHALKTFTSYPTLRLQDGFDFAQALDWYEQGMDVADAIHLVNGRHCAEMISFDRPFANTAKRLGATRVVPPPPL